MLDLEAFLNIHSYSSDLLDHPKMPHPCRHTEGPPRLAERAGGHRPFSKSSRLERLYTVT